MSRFFLCLSVSLCWCVSLSVLSLYLPCPRPVFDVPGLKFARDVSRITPRDAGSDHVMIRVRVRVRFTVMVRVRVTVRVGVDKESYKPIDETVCLSIYLPADLSVCSSHSGCLPILFSVVLTLFCMGLCLS